MVLSTNTYTYLDCIKPIVFLTTKIGRKYY
jgi:hypothetical protein